MKQLNPTAYAILGLLSLRSWTTYELTQQMQRALGRFWPRAESGIYTVPKALVRDGLAEAEPDAVGARRRTRYRISPAGRHALKTWRQPQGNPAPTVEFEQLIRVFFAEYASKAEILGLLQAVRTTVEDRAAAGAGISQNYLDGRGAFPTRLPWLILVGRFITDFDVMVDEWAAWATEVVQSWPDDLTQAEPDLAALRHTADVSARFVQRVQERPDPTR
jgi:DNA-binding PadR family transcriptional regulator